MEEPDRHQIDKLEEPDRHQNGKLEDLDRHQNGKLEEPDEHQNGKLEPDRHQNYADQNSEIESIVYDSFYAILTTPWSSARF